MHCAASSLVVNFLSSLSYIILYYCLRATVTNPHNPRQRNIAFVMDLKYKIDRK